MNRSATQQATMGLRRKLNSGLFIIVLLFARVAPSSTATTCQPGQYSYYGKCTDCAPCPTFKYGFNEWVEVECVTAFHCPNLCRPKLLGDRRWEEHELADESFCKAFGGTTTTHTTTVKIKTTTKEDHTSPNNDVSPTLVFPDTGKSSRDNGEQGLSLWATLGIVAGCLAVCIGVTLFFYRKIRSKKFQYSKLPELIDSLSSTPVSIVLHDYMGKSDIKVALYHGETPLSTKSLTSEELAFGFKDGVRPGRQYTLKYFSSDVEHGGKELYSAPHATQDFFSHISPLYTSISAQWNTTSEYLSVNLYDVSEGTNIQIDSRKACKQLATYGTEGDILPGKRYKLEAVESSSPKHGWKEERTVSTPEWKFDAKVNECCKIKIQNLPDDKNSLALRNKRKCFFGFCPCIRNMSDGCLRYNLPSSSTSPVQYDCPLLEKLRWKSIPVKLCLDIKGEVHIAGKQRIRSDATDLCDNDQMECTGQFMKMDPLLKKALSTVLNPRSFQQFCELFVGRCNTLNTSAGNDHFSVEKLAKTRVDGDEFLDGLLTLFGKDEISGTTIYQLIELLVTKTDCQRFPEEFEMFADAILSHHVCAACRTHIHRILHEPGEDMQPESGYDASSLEETEAVLTPSHISVTSNGIATSVSNGNATPVGTPV